MYRGLVLLPLALWIATVQAFYPYTPNFLKVDEASSRKRADQPDVQPIAPSRNLGFISFKLVPRAPISNGLRDGRISGRANTFKVAKAVQPTLKNAVGVDQDGTDFTYFLEVGFGSKSKPMYLLLDTGASSTWVMGSSCASKACKTHSTFGTADSTTLKTTDKTMSIGYGTGSVTGVYASDTIDLSGLKAPLEFGLANDTSDIFESYPFDGILGLWRGGGSQNFLDALKSSGIITTRVFGVSLARASDGTNDGEVAFGATNPAKYTGDITYTPLDTKASGENSWVVPLDEVVVNGKPSGIKTKLANIDTGTTYAFGPPADVEAMFKQIPNAQTTDGGMTWTIPCSTKATIAFTFSGKSFAISQKDFMSNTVVDGTTDRCPCNIFGREVVKGSWLLGATFLKNVYTVFDIDQSRIGFAQKPAAPPPAATSSPTTTTAGSSTIVRATSAVSSAAATSAASATSMSTPGTGLTGLHETASSVPAVAISTATPSSSPSASPSSSGEQLKVDQLHVSILCVLSVLAMVG